MDRHTEADPSSPQPVLEALNAFQRSELIKAAIELDLFTALGKDALDAQEIARACGAHPRGVRILCDALVVHGFLRKEGRAYRLSKTAARYLDRRSPHFLGDAVAFLHAPFIRQAFASLSEAAKRGGTALQEGGTTAPALPAWADFARVMAGVMRPAARSAARALVAGSTGLRRILDVACGHGLFGFEVLRSVPGAHGVGIDWPHVVEVARTNAVRYGLEDRFTAMAGDAFDVDWGSGYDLVILANLLHHYEEARVVRLLEKARECLRAEGRVAIVEFIPDEDRVHPPEAAAFALVMLATTPRGDAYTFEEYRRFLERAGFRDAELFELEESPERLVVARPRPPSRSAL